MEETIFSADEKREYPKKENLTAMPNAHNYKI